MERDIYFFGQTAYVTYNFLKNRGVPPSTIYNNTSKKTASNIRWLTSTLPANTKIKLIAYDSLPSSLISKHHLPSQSDLKEMSEIQIQQIRDKLKLNISKHVKLILDLEYDAWEEHKDKFENSFLSGEKLEMYCKTYALFKKIIELTQLGYKLKPLFDTYYQYDNLIFQTESFRTFCEKIRLIKKGQEIEKVLMHGLINRPSNNLKKEEDVIIEIKRCFSDGKKLNAASILKQVNEYLIRSNRAPISISSIYDVISSTEVKNETMILRHGKRYSENHLFPHHKFEPPKAPGILWEIDGTRFQFYYKTKTNKYNTLIYFIIMETFDRTIIGYSYDDSENTEMVKNAFEMACSKTQYLPLQIVSDNSKIYDSKDFSKIRSLLKLWKVTWNQTNMNPRNNSYVERFFGVFQESYCKEVDGYIGNGLTSTSINGKPSPEEIKRFLSTKKLYSKEDLISKLEYLIKEYNKSKANASQNLIVNTKVNPICFNTIMFSQLFWQEKEANIISNTISFELAMKNYSYNIYDESISRRYNGTRILVRYNPKNLDKILLFDLKTDEYIVTLDLYRVIPYSKFERSTSEDKCYHEVSAKMKKLREDTWNRAMTIVALSDANRAKLPPKLIEFGIGSKQELEEAEGTFVSEELEKASKEIINNSAQNMNFDLLFRNLYTKKARTFKKRTDAGQ